MATEQAVDVENGAAFEAHVARLQRRLRHEPGSGLWLQASRQGFAQVADVVVNAKATAITFSDPQGWLRVFASAFPGEVLRERSNEIALRIRATGSGQAALDRIVILSGADDRTFRMLHRLSKERVVGAGWEEYRFNLSAALGRSLVPEAEAAAACFLVIEFRQAAAIEIASFTIAEAAPTTSSAPYLSSPLPICGELADLNADFSSVGRRDRKAWMLRAAELAVRLDCHGTAEALLERLEGTLEPTAPDTWRRYLTIRAQVGIVTGRLAQVSDLLLQNLDVVLTDDRLTTALAVTLETDPSHLPLVGRLPSGRLNRFFLSRLESDAAALRTVGESLNDSAPSVGNDGDERMQRMLLLASQLRRQSPAAALHWLNRAFAIHGLAPITRLGPTESNHLASVAFAALPNAPPGPLVSVIMAAFNAENTLQYAVRSILGQTYRDLEILLCDDCSTDDTWRIALALRASDPRIRLFRSRANQGPYNIRNALIEAATGRYITFADADDVSHPSRLERQIDALRTATDRQETPPVATMGRWIRMMPDGRIPFFRDHLACRMAVVSILAPAALFKTDIRYRSVLCGADTEVYEGLRVRHGQHAVLEVKAPLILGLWSQGSLTRQPGLEATEDGYRSPARLAYGEIAARQRLLGKDIVPDADIEAVLREHGIYRDPSGVDEVDGDD